MPRPFDSAQIDTTVSLPLYLLVTEYHQHSPFSILDPYDNTNLSSPRIGRYLLGECDFHLLLLPSITDGHL